MAQANANAESAFHIVDARYNMSSEILLCEVLNPRQEYEKLVPALYPRTALFGSSW